MNDTNETLDMLGGVAERLDDEIQDGINEKMGINQDDQQSMDVAVLPPMRDEIADLLDLVAQAGGMTLPTIPTHFNHDANLNIADAMIKLADRYNYDLRSKLLDTDSPMMAWLGLAFALGAPAKACFIDYQRAKAARAAAQKEEAEKEPAKQTQSPVKQDEPVNSIASGAE